MSQEGYKQWAKDVAEFAAFPAAVKNKPTTVATKAGWSTGKKVIVGGGIAAVLLAGAIYASRD